MYICHSEEFDFNHNLSGKHIYFFAKLELSVSEGTKLESGRAVRGKYIGKHNNWLLLLDCIGITEEQSCLSKLKPSIFKKRQEKSPGQ